MQQTENGATTRQPTWSRPKLEKLGTLADVAGPGTGTRQGNFQPTLS